MVSANREKETVAINILLLAATQLQSYTTKALRERKSSQVENFTRDSDSSGSLPPRLRETIRDNSN